VPYNRRMKIPIISSESILKVYQLSRDDLKGILPHILISVAVFLTGIAIGLIFPQRFASLFTEFSKSTSHLLDRDFLALAGLIFIRNTLASAIAISFGIFLGLIPLAAAFINGALVGTVLSGVEATRKTAAVLMLLPHGIFELPALFISWGTGIWVGTNAFRKEKETFRERQKKVIRIFFLIILPLLLIAAVIESSAIALLRRV
jgi:stage II sporulation protein M